MEIGTKAAAIDIGTNSVRMLLAVYDGIGFAGEKQVTITRLGEGLIQTKRLSNEAMRRTVEAVRAFVSLARQEGVVDPVYCYATSAAREAKNGKHFLSMLLEIDGVEAEIVSGKEEANLAYQGASSLGDVVMDIGGGSTELSRMKNGSLKSRSVPLGTVTSLERYSSGRAISQLQLMAMAQRVKNRVVSLCRSVLGKERIQTLVGVGGTATQLAMLFVKQPAYDPNRVHGFAMSMDDLNDLQNELIHKTTTQRQQMPGMHPKRADVIVTGCLIARMVMMESGAQTLIASDHDGLDVYLSNKYRSILDKE